MSPLDEEATVHRDCRPGVIIFILDVAWNWRCVGCINGNWLGAMEGEKGLAGTSAAGVAEMTRSADADSDAGTGGAGGAAATAMSSPGREFCTAPVRGVPRVVMREATKADVDVLVAMHGDGFVRAHTDVIEDKVLARFASGERFRAEWEESLGITEARGGKTTVASSRVTLVLESVGSVDEERKVLGFAAVELAGRHSLRRCPSVPTQLRKLYLSRDCPRRRGYGSMLFRQAMQRASMMAAESTSKDGTGSMAIWCLGGNTVACRFYEAMGCHLVISDSHAKFGSKRYSYRCYIASLVDS